MSAVLVRKHIRIQGVVQSVGFRPFVYRLALAHNVRGFILNSSEGVVIEAEGAAQEIESFLGSLRTKLPPLARIDRMAVADRNPLGDAAFVIEHSVAAVGGFALVPPDVAVCPDCVADFTAPGNRRFGYPFTNCTNCGPRYTIIRDVPYDRPNTTMDEFALCERCRAEYEDPLDRRFHAEPNACPDCGPSLALTSGTEPVFTPHRNAEILDQVRSLLRGGAIVAIKGLGGFHLACDAASEAAVCLLRERKRRSGKAFAMMVRDLSVAERICVVTGADRDLLTSWRCPIVLLPRREGAEIAASVAPGNARLGIMLPYTPLHHLLFRGPDAPEALVMTSGNRSEEPIVSRNEEARERLHGIADYFLLHNRRIQTCVDDSVVQTFEGKALPVRRSRGYAPEPVDLGMPLTEVLACGGELKNTLCLTKDRYAILSQHIGDLENLQTMELFRETLHHLSRFFRVEPVAAAHDLHPHYLSTRYALEQSGLPPVGVQHHHAHIASCMADNGLQGRVIGVAFDGTGYGTDGQVWGGEFLLCDYLSFERRGHLRYTPLAGGDSAVRQPWRSALAHLRDTGLPPAPLCDIPARKIAVVDRMIARGIQTVQTSSCGRLFDAVSSLLGICHETTYEGQAAMELEAAATSCREPYPFALTDAAGPDFEVDLRGTIEGIVRDLRDGATTGAISARFHLTVARVIVDACLRIRRSDSLNRVCLSGGTFQNIRLLSLATAGLREEEFEVFIHRRVPPNDGGLALGQAAIASEILRSQGKPGSGSHENR